MTDIKIYTSPNDRFPDFLRNFLVTRNIDFEENDIRDDPKIFDMIMKSPPRRPPALTYKGKLMFSGPSPWIERYSTADFLQKLEELFANNESWR